MAGLQDYLRQLLGEEPKLSYYADLYGQQRSPNQLNFGQNAYQAIYNQYFGALGQQIQQGQEPTLQWTDFLNQTPFAQRFAQQTTPQQRGAGRFNPPTQWKW